MILRKIIKSCAEINAKTLKYFAKPVQNRQKMNTIAVQTTKYTKHHTYEITENIGHWQ